MGTTAVGSLLGVVFWGVSTHLLAPRQIGAAAIALAFVNGFALLGSQGIQPALIVRLPKLPEESRAAATVAAVAVAAAAATTVAAIGVIVVVLVSTTLRGVLDPPLAALVVVAAGTQAAAGVTDAACVAERRSRGMTGRNAAFGITKLILVAVTLGLLSAADRASLGAALLVAAWALSNGVSTVVALRWLHGRGKGRIATAELVVQARSLRGVGAHHLATLGGQVPGYLFPIIVGARLGAEPAAVFNIAWMVGGICVFISPAVGTALLADGGHEPSRIVARARASAVLIGLGLVVPVLVLILAGEPLLGLFGDRYATSAGRWLLIAVALSAVPDAVTNLAVSVWRVRGRLTAPWLLNVGMAMTSLTSAWLLLPRVGVSAPGWGWLGAQTLGTAAVILSIGRVRRVARSSISHTRASEA
jgi:O-antigen/teichoic acid export membrane protein